MDWVVVWGYNEKDVFEICSSVRQMGSRQWA